MLIFSLTKFIFLPIIKPNDQFEKMNTFNSGLMTIEDLASYLKVTRRTIYEWLKNNKIPAVKLVGQWRFRKDRIDAWIEEQSKHN